MFVLVFVGLVAVGYLLWRAFGPGGPDLPGRPAPTARKPRPIGPDDDPEFLHQLDRDRDDS